MARRLSLAFYRRQDVCAIARDLLGKQLCTRLPLNPSVAGTTSLTVRTAGIIVETEAYAGPEDRASHAFANRRTARTAVMFEPGGVAYVYLCYGVHALLNVVTHGADVPHAVLIRAIAPTHGLAHMRHRRNMPVATPRLTAGPGALTRAMGILPAHTGTNLRGNQIWIEDVGTAWTGDAIVASPRVGVDYAGPHAHRPWRYQVRGNAWISRAT
ncbi:MAG: DNA-3-methyladenine glycosylase [Verrucomicrobia bacterium]|nr:DNA-3-methyladenine glycosylase [Verrucomicrobiota bacterium]